MKIIEFNADDWEVALLEVETDQFVVTLGVLISGLTTANITIETTGREVPQATYDARDSVGTEIIARFKRGELVAECRAFIYQVTIECMAATLTSTIRMRVNGDIDALMRTRKIPVSQVQLSDGC